MSKISSFPIPIELLVVVTGTLVSNHWSLKDAYGVTIIGEVPSGYAFFFYINVLSF